MMAKIILIEEWTKCEEQREGLSTPMAGLAGRRHGDTAREAALPCSLPSLLLTLILSGKALLFCGFICKMEITLAYLPSWQISKCTEVTCVGEIEEGQELP